ncbi:NAD(P)/FAD-dependent oxidoreductase [Maribacter algicola]|uniref:NAD(P)/FAD-dependent oxidoreductase n=1 Tax=Meishania litoralis TaxID=3434685 RepID=A0ACC7LMH7_9FLAO
MNLSYWEYKTWFSNIDFTIIGSGIVGLSCALNLQRQYPKARILVLEKGSLPQGASTKNAGFACFGSISEIISDLRSHSESEVQELVKRRYEGIKLLRNTLGDLNIGFHRYDGGHELFVKANARLYEECRSKLDDINELLEPVFFEKAFQVNENSFEFANIYESYISNRFEGQLHTGKLMKTLLEKVLKGKTTILNAVRVTGFAETGNGVEVATEKFDFKTDKLLIATNGFASELAIENVRPARAQVLITRPIKNLHIKGTFHLDEGYYYFRNIDNRILLGGGRNLDFKGEETSEFGETDIIQNKLETLLTDTILPKTHLEVDRRWSGIMGIGDQKRPIVKQLSDNVCCGVRLGGMGIAIGSAVGRELAELI